MEIWGIYPTFCVYLCLSVRGSAADIYKGIHLHPRRLQPPLWDQAHLAPNSGATCLRAKRRKTCSLHELWKRSWLTRRLKRLTIHSCAKPARWHLVSYIVFASHCSFLGLIDLDTSCTLSLINRLFCNVVAVLGSTVDTPFIWCFNCPDASQNNVAKHAYLIDVARAPWKWFRI